MAKTLYLASTIVGGQLVGGIKVDQDNGVVTIPLLNAPSPVNSNAAKGTAASISDGDTIPHTLAHTPTFYRASGTVAGETVTAVSADGTNITIAIKKPDGSAGTDQTVMWEAEIL